MSINVGKDVELLRVRTPYYFLIAHDESSIDLRLMSRFTGFFVFLCVAVFFKC